MSGANDPYELSRFVAAQKPVLERALREITAGRKESHWMWFIFPQVAGLGTSDMARRYAISGLAEAEAYVAHTILGPRLIECCEALLRIKGRTAHDIFGYPDDLKLRSSMTLFARVGKTKHLCQSVLDKYFGGDADERTMQILRRHTADCGDGRAGR